MKKIFYIGIFTCLLGAGSLQALDASAALMNLANKGLGELATLLEQRERIFKDLAILTKYKQCAKARNNLQKQNKPWPQKNQEFCTQIAYINAEGVKETEKLDQEIKIKQALGAAKDLLTLFALGIFGTQDKPGMIEDFFKFISAVAPNQQTKQKINEIAGPIIQFLKQVIQFAEILDSAIASQTEIPSDNSDTALE